MYLDVHDENPFGTNCWLLGAEGSEEAVIVDPGFDAPRVLAKLAAAGRRPVAVLATHGHGDHVAEAAAAAGGELPVYVHAADEAAFTDPVGWGSGFPVMPPVPADLRTLTDGQVLDFAGFSIEVQHTTPGSVCFVTDAFVLSGDLVFRGTIGRSDFPHSDPEAMVESLRRFLKLPDHLDVYPGHMERTTVGLERRTNPFLAGLA